MLDDVQEMPVEQEAVQEQAQPEVKQEPKVDDQKEQNFRILRERAEAAERRARELEQYLSAQQPKQEQHEIDDDDIDIKDDDFVEGKQVKKYIKSLKKDLKETKKQIAESYQNNAVATAEMRLKAQFTDFDAVVTKENIEKLAYSKPSLYRSIMASPDIYDRGYTAYEMIKSSGIIDNQYNKEEERINTNKTKVRSSSAAAPQTPETPLSRAGDYGRRILTEERKEQLRRQVEEAKRNY